MAGPWEQYQQTAQAAGPWLKYAQPEADAVSFARDPVAGAVDVAKSGSVGLAQGAIQGVGTAGDLQQFGDKYIKPGLEGLGSYIPQGVKDAFARGAVPEHRKDRYMPNAPTSAEIQSDVESKTGEFYKPKTTAGKYANTVGQFAGNPITWMGPGSMALKAGGAVASGIGSEAAGQAAEGTGYEGPARFGGALLGGVAAAKTLGPGSPKAAIPTYKELKDAATADYNAARASGLELHPKGVGAFAGKVEQELSGPNHGFTGGPMGDAPKTFAIVESLQNAPGGSTVTASNIDALRKNVGRLARETKDGKPTPDAAAASVLLGRLNGYLENLPQNHIVAGNPADYVRATKQANANYAAAQRVRTLDLKKTRAENNAEGGIATSVDNQIKSQMRTILNNPAKQAGFSADELSAIQGVNKGTLTSNMLRQLGRGGAGVIPIMAHLTAAGASGGATIPIQMALAAGLYGSRKGAEAMTKSHLNKVAEMLAKRSPEYQKRAASLPAYDGTPNKAAIIRALLAH